MGSPVYALSQWHGVDVGGEIRYELDLQVSHLKLVGGRDAMMQ